MHAVARSRRSTQIVGALVLVATALLLTLAYLKPNPFADQQTVRAVFADASGVGVVGQDVRMAGVPVGRITEVERDGDNALLTMQVEDDAGAIHSDARAELRPHLTFEGTAYVDLDPGSRGAPALGDAPIPLSQTHSYVPLDEALRVFQPATRRALQEDVNGLGEALQGEGAAGVQETLRGAPQLTRTLAAAADAAAGSHGDELVRSIRGLSHTADAVAARRAQLVPLLRGANRTLAALDTDGGAPLDATLATLPATLEALDSGGRALDGIVRRLDPLARELEPGLAALAPTLARATPLVRDAGPALAAATPLIADLRQALEAGAAATPPTQRLLGKLDPSLRLVRGSLLPALHAPTAELEIPAYRAFLNLFEGGGGASRPFQTDDSGPGSTPGHFMRFGIRFLSGAGYPTPPCSLLAQASPQIAAAVSAAGGCTP